ncbi:hypothetical protein M514_04578, partial [Trichuris suis]
MANHLTLPPNIDTTPAEELWLNGPCLMTQSTSLQIMNPGTKRLMWRIYADARNRYLVRPKRGVLKGKEKFNLFVLCYPFPFRPDSPNTDTLTIEWTEATENHDHFDEDWFSKSRVARRKNINVSFNP